jgi:hypothetical protein
MHLTKKFEKDQVLTKKCDEIEKNIKETHRGFGKRKNMFKRWQMSLGRFQKRSRHSSL